MDQKCLPSWRNPARYPTSHDADVFVHASHLMGGVHQRGGRRAAHRAAHRGAVGPERSGRSILKLTSLCRCAGPREAAFCILRAMRHRGCNGISGRVFEHSGAPWPSWAVEQQPIFSKSAAARQGARCALLACRVPVELVSPSWSNKLVKDLAGRLRRASTARRTAAACSGS